MDYDDYLDALALSALSDNLEACHEIAEDISYINDAWLLNLITHLAPRGKIEVVRYLLSKVVEEPSDARLIRLMRSLVACKRLDIIRLLDERWYVRQEGTDMVEMAMQGGNMRLVEFLVLHETFAFHSRQVAVYAVSNLPEDLLIQLALLRPQNKEIMYEHLYTINERGLTSVRKAISQPQPSDLYALLAFFQSGFLDKATVRPSPHTVMSKYALE